MFYIPPPPPQKFIFKLPFVLQKFCPKSHSEPTGEESHTNQQSFRADRRWISHKPKSVIQGRLLRLALNGYTQIQIEKILFPIMNFRFSPYLEFLPRSQSFGKGTPFQKPQSVRYPAWMPYRNSLCSACRRISCKPKQSFRADRQWISCKPKQSFRGHSPKNLKQTSLPQKTKIYIYIS